MISTNCISQQYTITKNPLSSQNIAYSPFHFQIQSPIAFKQDFSINNKFNLFKVQQLIQTLKQLRQALDEIVNEVYQNRIESRKMVEELLWVMENYGEVRKKQQRQNDEQQEMEQFKFHYQQIEIQRNDLRVIKQIYQQEINRLKLQNQQLSQQNFTFKQRIVTLQQEGKEQLEISTRKIRQEYETYYTQYERGLSQEIQKVIRVKDEMIQQLKSGMKRMSQNYWKKRNIMENSSFLERNILSPKGMHSPVTSAIDLLPLLENIKSQQRLGFRSDQFLNQQSIKNTRFQTNKVWKKQRLLTEIISPIKPKSYTRIDTLMTESMSSKFGKGKAERSQRLVSPKGHMSNSKINFGVLEKEIEQLSSKIRHEINSMNSSRK